MLALASVSVGFAGVAHPLVVPRAASVFMQEAEVEAEVAAAPAAPIPAAEPAVVMPTMAVPMGGKSAAIPSLDAPAYLDGSMAGDLGFDPLGFSNYELGPFDTPAEHMGWMREAELKHGRACMLAVTGWIAVDLGLRAPYLPQSMMSLTSYQAHDAAVANGSLLVLLIACGVFEIAGAGGIAATLKGERVPGEFALDGGFEARSTPKEWDRLKTSEVVHCRLAMLAFSGVATQGGLTEGLTPVPYF